MRVGVAAARQRFKELLDRVATGQTVEITRRNTVVAVLGPPVPPAPDRSLAEALADWRRDWDVDSWPDDDPFADVRDASPGRRPPW
jgi:prevent-host-death family protein